MPNPTGTGHRHRLTTTAKRLLVLVAGCALCGAGLAMLVLPGPGILVVFLGLLVLATEFAWAERAVERTRRRAVNATGRLQATRATRLTVAVTGVALVTGGGAAVAIVDNHRYLGVSAFVAGLGALAVLIPATQRLLDRETASPSDPAPAQPVGTAIDSKES
jgi:uncharacterized protein (TIGR02611 family)